MKVEQTKGIVMDFVLGELQKIMETCVVKLQYIADKYETKESKLAGDIYTACVNGRDSFSSYMTYSDYALRKCFDDEDFIEQCKVDRNKIPPEKREEVLKYQREYVLQTFEETNNYYRMLNGLPDIEDNEFIYIDKNIAGVDTTKPIHLMNKDEIVIINTAGIIDALKAKYPTKRYLWYLHESKIPINVSRYATNFSLLYIRKTSVDPSFSMVFLRIYNECKSYVLSKLYDSAYKRNSEYYDAFIGIFILTITSQRFISHYFKSGIARDFYDKDIIKMLFDSYGLPFYNDINLAYLRRVARNLNLLLRFKATDKVFIDIFDLFDMENVEIYKYYLIKDHKKDIYGNPVFSYKKDDKTGELVPDVENQYSLRFAQVPRTSKNVSLDIQDPANHLDYFMVTTDDILWGDDGDKTNFMRQILESEFNYVETKYIAVSSRYELTKLTFEICYFFRMIVDTVPAQELMEMEVRYVDGTCKLFHVVVALFALMCKKFNFDGNIMDTTTKIMSVYGYNFKADMDYIDEIIETHRLTEFEPTLDTDALKIKDYPPIFTDSADMVNLYLDNKDVHDTILKKKYEAKNIYQYNAYKKIYDATMITDYVTDMYRDQDGVLPKTYLEYLKINEFDLYKFVVETPMDNMVESLDALLVALENFFKNDKFKNVFLNIPSLSADNMRKFIYYLIDLFKSYTVDLAAMNIVYHIDNKLIHNLKMIFEDNPTADIEFFQPINFKFVFEILESNFELCTELRIKLKHFLEINFEKVEHLDLLEDFERHSTWEILESLGYDFFDIMYEELFEQKYDKMNIRTVPHIEYMIPALCKLIFKEQMLYTNPFELELKTRVKTKDEPNEYKIDVFFHKLFNNYIDLLYKDNIIEQKDYYKIKDKIEIGLCYMERDTDTGIKQFLDSMDEDSDVCENEKMGIRDSLSIVREYQ